MKWWALTLILVLVAAGIVWWIWGRNVNENIVSPVVDKISEKPFDKYTIESLGKRSFSSQIVLDEAVATESAYTAYRFHFDSDGKRVNGLAHIPHDCPCPAIVQFRGYVDLEIYDSGVGTKRSAEVFASNGFISLAPDFLGYGDSDNPSTDIFEARFETYTTALNLLFATSSLLQADPDRVGIWGHSNGGQIALTALEITGRDYPTVLWAPVSKPFPYSILYYTDEADDDGKALRKKLADFESDYDVFLYDNTRYLDKINAPIQIHQGGSDEAVPLKWSDELVSALKEQDVEVEYFIYPNSDHNMVGSWDTVVNRSVEFFQKNLSE